MGFTTEMMKKIWKVAKANPNFTKTVKGIGSYWQDAFKVVAKITKSVTAKVVTFMKLDGTLTTRKVVPASSVNSSYLDFVGGRFRLFDTEKKDFISFYPYQLI
jgi:hypothetical protein